MDMSIGSGIAVAGLMMATAVVFVGKLATDALVAIMHRYVDGMLRQADVFEASARRASSRFGES